MVCDNCGEELNDNNLEVECSYCDDICCNSCVDAHEEYCDSNPEND